MADAPDSQSGDHGDQPDGDATGGNVGRLPLLGQIKDPAEDNAVTNGHAVSSQPTKLSGSSGELCAMRASRANARIEAISAAAAVVLDIVKIYYTGYC